MLLRGRERAGGEGGGCGGGGRRNSCSEVVTTLGTQPQHSQCLTLSGATAATATRVTTISIIKFTEKKCQ